MNLVGKKVVSSTGFEGVIEVQIQNEERGVMLGVVDAQGKERTFRQHPKGRFYGQYNNVIDFLSFKNPRAK